MIHRNRLLYILFLAAGLASCTLQVTLSPNANIREKERVIFADFKVPGVVNPEERERTLEREFMDAFSGCLLHSPLVVLDNHKVEILLKERSMSAEEFFTSMPLQSIGKLLEADYIIFGAGELNQSLNETYLRTATIRMIQVKTGEVVLVGMSENPSGRPAIMGRNLGCEVRDKLLFGRFQEP